MKHATDPRITRSPRASKVTTLLRLMGMDDFTRERRMSLHILVVTAIAAVAWLAVGVGPVHATTPGQNGRIAAATIQ